MLHGPEGSAVVSLNICRMHAAEGYNKSQSERLCCVMTTSGPGATNLCTGIASCWRDGVPLVVITSQVGVEGSELKPSMCPLCWFGKSLRFGAYGTLLWS